MLYCCPTSFCRGVLGLTLAEGDEGLGKELVARLMNEMHGYAKRGVPTEVTALLSLCLTLEHVAYALHSCLGIRVFTGKLEELRGCPTPGGLEQRGRGVIDVLHDMGETIVTVALELFLGKTEVFGSSTGEAVAQGRGWKHPGCVGFVGCIEEIVVGIILLTNGVDVIGCPYLGICPVEQAQATGVVAVSKPTAQHEA